jgi:hypothetical protein
MSTKADRERVARLLALSPQSRASLAGVEGWDEPKLTQVFGEPHMPSYAGLTEALDDLITDDTVEEYEDGKDAAGNPIIMYRLEYREYQRVTGKQGNE